MGTNLGIDSFRVPILTNTVVNSPQREHY